LEGRHPGHRDTSQWSPDHCPYPTETFDSSPRAFCVCNFCQHAPAIVFDPLPKLSVLSVFSGTARPMNDFSRFLYIFRPSCDYPSHYCVRNPLRSACHPSSLSIHTSSYLSIPQQHPPTHVVSLVLSLQLFAFSTIQSRSFVGSHFEWAQTKHLAVVGRKFSVASFQISAEAEVPRKVFSKCSSCCATILD